MATESEHDKNASIRKHTFPGAVGAAGIALILPLLASQALQAEPIDATVSPPTNASRGTGDLEEITVTATRRSESQSKVAIAIKAFDSDAITARGIASETDLQQSVPGLTV